MYELALIGGVSLFVAGLGVLAWAAVNMLSVFFCCFDDKADDKADDTENPNELTDAE